MHQRLALLIVPALVLGSVRSLPVPAAAAGLEPLVYTVTFPEPAKNYAAVEVTVSTGKEPVLEMMMPIWTPGFYRIEDYASKVHPGACETGGTGLSPIPRVNSPRAFHRWPELRVEALVARPGVVA